VEKYVVANSRLSPLLIETGTFWNRCAADAVNDVWLANNFLIQDYPNCG
jgi:hypothetical protein